MLASFVNVFVCLSSCWLPAFACRKCRCVRLPVTDSLSLLDIFFNAWVIIECDPSFKLPRVKERVAVFATQRLKGLSNLFLLCVFVICVEVFCCAFFELAVISAIVSDFPTYLFPYVLNKDKIDAFCF